MTGLEALARWRQPDGSLSSAGTFIDVATETGLITQIDSMILERSFATLATLSATMPDPPCLSINLSSGQLGNKALPEWLLDQVFAQGLSPDQINIEVLESTLLDDRADQVGRTIHELAEAGFRIELDDFGTGHTALASLTAFPVHQIKVDRSLISGLDRNPKKRAVTAGLFLVCTKLGIDAIGEGVETAQEFEELRSIGFRRFQGYYFAKPIAGCDVSDWIARWNAEARAV